MGNVWHELRDFWFTINMWARNVIRILIASPILVLLTALVTASGWAIAIATILPVLLFTALVLGYTDPLLFGIGIGAVPQEGRKVFTFLAGLVGLELSMGLLFLTLYGWEVPVLPIMLLIMFTAAAFLHIGGLLKGWAKRLIILAFITIFLIYWWPGIFRAAKTASRRTSSAVERCVDQGGGFRDCLNKNLSSAPSAPVAGSRTLAKGDFRLKPGEELVTGIGLKKGVEVCFNASENFYLKDGPREHLMPKGRSCGRANGDPEGSLVIKGAFTESVVQLEARAI